MRKTLYSCSAAITFVLFFLPNLLSAQNNLKVNFKNAASAPRNLNVCGNEATVIVTVSTDGSLAATRQNIQAKLNLFKGIEIVRFDAANSSSGVSLLNATDPNKPLFGLPNLNPSGISSVDVAYVIRANCKFTDSISVNNLADVVDQWDFSYRFGAQNQTETDLSTSYRDQVKYANIVLSVSNNAPSGSRVGLCYQRKTIVSNSAVVGKGWIKEFAYTNKQGAGVTVSSITVNGKNMPFTKTPAFNAAKDTIIKFFVIDTLFKYNTIGLTAPSNGDLLFEADESVTIVENFCLVNCSDSRVSIHEVAWGCDGRYCSTVSAGDNIPLGQGSVNVNFSTMGSTANVVGGYCTNGRQTIKFSNTGVEVDPGTATMFDVSTGVGLGTSLLLRGAGYRISSMTIGGLNITGLVDSGLVNINNNPLFATDPDGVGGLSDVDNDGFFDDLPVGQSFEISVNYEVECSAVVSSGDKKCVNNFQTDFYAKLNYTDVCQNPTNYLPKSFFNPINKNSFIENCVAPDANTDGTPFTIEHKEIRTVSNFERNCNGQEQFVVAVKLAPGVTAIKDSMFMFWYEDTLPLLSFRISNDTAYGIFDATKATYLNGEYYNKMSFKADCTAKPGLIEYPMNITFVCPPCDCRHVWYCDTLKSTNIHYNVPPCPANPAYECDKGLKTTSFQVERTTFGYTEDTLYKTKINPALANKGVALACDSVKMTVTNIVGNANIADSIGILISYDNISRGDSNRFKDIFTFGKGQAFITHLGQNYSCPIDATKLKRVVTDSSKAMYFDLNACLTGLGIGPLSKGDSVNFVGDFAVNPDGPYNFTFDKVPNFRAKGYYIENDSAYACDNYGVIYRVGRSQALASFPSTQDSIIGCKDATLECKITMFNNDYKKYFGDEYRQSVGVDSITISYDKNLTKAFSTSLEVSIPNHPIFGDAYFPVANLDNSGKYVLRFDTLKQVPSLNKLTSYAFNLRIKAIPNCATFTGSSTGNNVFYFSPKIGYRDRYYAKDIGDGSCSPYIIGVPPVGNEHIDYANPAVLSLTPISNPNIVIANDTAEWTVKLCNTSTSGFANHSWIALTPTTPSVKNFRVVSITDVTNNLVPINYGVKYYGLDSINAYAYMNGLTQATIDKNIDDVCNVVKIRARVRECGTTDVAFHSGWLCALPTDPNWTPAKYAPCVDSVILGTVKTENPFLNANYINQNITVKPGVCDTTTLEIIVKNSGIGTVYDVKTRLTIPLTGATLVPNSIELAYPAGAAYQTLATAPTSVGVNAKGQNFEYADFAPLSNFLKTKGLAGFNPANPNDSNQFKLRFKFVTDCDFKSGALSYFSFGGKTICGTPSNIQEGESLPIEIQGAVLNPVKSYSVSSDATNKFVAGGVVDIKVSITNLTSELSDADDLISVKLPSGVRYKAGSSMAITPATWTPTNPTIKYVGKIQILTWQQPVGLKLNEKATLKFAVATDDTLPCVGNSDMTLSTLHAVNLTCKAFNTICRSELLTTKDGEQFYTIPLSNLTISFVSNLSIANNTILAGKGDTIKIFGIGAQKYRWFDTDSLKLLGTDSVLTYIPNRPVAHLSVKSGLILGCVDSASLTIFFRLDTVPPKFVTVDSLLKNKNNGDTLTSFACNQPLFLYLNSVKITDSLDANPILKLDSTVRNGNCPVDGFLILKTYTWTATDSSGNVSTFKIFVKITDNQPPVLVNVPADVTISAVDPIPSANVSATDNCTSVTLNSTITIKNIVGKDTTFERIWTAIDQCGNVARDTQIITKLGYETPSVNLYKDTIFVGDSVVYCLNTLNLGLKGGNYSITNTCQTLNPHVIYAFNTLTNCLTIKGFKIGTDTACLTICTDSSTCAQVKFVTAVLKVPVDTIPVILVVKQSDTICIPHTRITGKVTLTNACPDPNNVFSYVVYQDSCIIITALKEGISKACIVICDSTGKKCDTTIIKITVNKIPTILIKNDTILRGDSLKFCLSTLNLPGTINSVVNNCSTTSNIHVSYTLDAANCLIIKGLSRGTDTACYTICTTADTCVEIIIKTTVVTKADTIKVPTYEGHNDTICLTPKNITGGTLILTNICPDPSNPSVVFEIKDSCVIIKSLVIGAAKGCFTLCNSKGECDTTIIVVTVRTPSVIERKDTILVADSLKICLSDLGLTGAFVSVKNGCSSTSDRNASYTFDAANCLIIKGLYVGVDTACLTICTKDTCLTVKFITVVISKPDTIVRAIPIGKTDSICLSRKGLKGDSLTLTNICPDPLSTTVTYEVTKDFCIKYTGNDFGTAKSCWVLCDTFGHCDTTILTVNVITPSVTVRYDTIMVGDYIVECFDTLKLKGKIISVQNMCPGSSNIDASYVFGLNHCLMIRGLTVGNDTACFILCTDSNDCKAVTFITTVVPRLRMDTITKTIDVTKSDTFCLNIGRPIVGGIKNICADLTDTTVTYTVLNDTCVIFKGNKIGTSKACWVACDKDNVCDTIVLVVNVVDPTKFPIANDDTATTKINTKIPIYVSINDTINGTFKSITIVSKPAFGTAETKFVDGQWIIEYTPNLDYCKSTERDQFMYELCNENGCDLAAVNVRVKCEGLVIYNGFTPDGNEINEFFHIDGLEDYPNTKVNIYNRWGNQVYESEDYKNNWDGTWQKLLVPDGTYFYRVATQSGDVYTGYLQIHR